MELSLSEQKVLLSEIIKQLEVLTSLAQNGDTHKVDSKVFKKPVATKVEFKEEHRQVPIDMGLGKLGNPSIVFPREFRFLLESKLLPDLHHFVKLVTLDYKSKTLYIEVLETYGEENHCGKMDNWVREFLRNSESNEELTLTTYDGCGTALYKISFTDLSVDGHQMNFSYDSSEVATQKIRFRFENSVRENLK